MEARMISELDMLLRVLAAAGLGAIVGYERERNHQPAGLRTHMVLVAGSALAMTLSINLASGPTNDPARLAAQVLTGIGFICAGAIMRFGPTVRGLTTAASLWTMAIVGLAVGAGYFIVAASVTALLIIVLSLLGIIEARFVKQTLNATFTVYTVDRPGIEQQVREVIAETVRHVESFHSDRRIHRQRIKLDAVVKLKPGESPELLSARLGGIKGVRIIRYE
jgi:putative Mg2+ transporter-C (MgtC) family protein